MAAVNPPYVLNESGAAVNPAEAFRQALKALRVQQGVVGAGDMAVSQHGGGNMSVDVAAGVAVIDGTENPTTQGAYSVTNDASVNLAVGASDPANPRRDLVVAKVQDTFYSGATDAWSLAVVQGVAAGVPVDPATPANAIVLARISIPANAASIVTAYLTDLRQRTVPTDPVLTALNKYRASVHLAVGGGQVITNNTPTVVLFDGVDDNPSGAYDAANHRFVAPVNGWYLVHSMIGFVTGAGGTGFGIGIAILVNGAVETKEALIPPSGGAGTFRSWISRNVKLNAGDTVSIRAYQVSGGNLTLNNSAAETWADFAYSGGF